MADTTFHFGKHKGKPLADIPEDYLEWVVMNHRNSQTVKVAQAELEKRAVAIVKNSGQQPAENHDIPGQLFTADQVEIAIPKGKHKGKLLKNLDDGTVHALWSSWNGSPKLKASPFFRHIVAEKSRRKGQPAGKHPFALAPKVITPKQPPTINGLTRPASHIGYPMMSAWMDGKPRRLRFDPCAVAYTVA